MQRRIVLAAILGAVLAGAGIAAYAIVIAQQGPDRPVVGGSSEHIGLPHTPSSEVAPTSCRDWGNQYMSGTAGFAIADKYGELRSCGLHGDTWVITTLGKIEASGVRGGGVIALYPCNGDQACLDNRNDHPFAGWTFVNPPYSGEISILREIDDQTLEIGVGNDKGGDTFTFNVLTRAFADVTPATPAVQITPAPGGG